MRKLFLITLMLFCLAACDKKDIQSKDEKESPLSYIYCDEGFYSLYRYNGESTVDLVVIAGEYDDGVHGKLPVKKIESGCFYKTEIGELQLPDSIIYIDSFAISCCNIQLINVEKIEEIADYAFNQTSFACELVFENLKLVSENALYSYIYRSHIVYRYSLTVYAPKVYLGCNENGKTSEEVVINGALADYEALKPILVYYDNVKFQ